MKIIEYSCGDNKLAKLEHDGMSIDTVFKYDDICESFRERKSNLTMRSGNKKYTFKIIRPTLYDENFEILWKYITVSYKVQQIYLDMTSNNVNYKTIDLLDIALKISINDIDFLCIIY